MFLEYSELLNSFDSGAVTKITINNRRLNRKALEQTILIPMRNDGLNEYRMEYNQMLLEKAVGDDAIVQEKYITISINKKDTAEARNYFARVGTELQGHFARLDSHFNELDATDKLRIIHDFFRSGEESDYRFDLKEAAKKGQDFRDFICPDSLEFEKDYFKMGERYGRVLFLRDFASYIKDNIVSQLTDLNRNIRQGVSCRHTVSPRIQEQTEQTASAVPRICGRIAFKRRR